MWGRLGSICNSEILGSCDFSMLREQPCSWVFLFFLFFLSCPLNHTNYIGPCGFLCMISPYIHITIGNPWCSQTSAASIGFRFVSIPTLFLCLSLATNLLNSLDQSFQRTLSRRRINHNAEKLAILTRCIIHHEAPRDQLSCDRLCSL